MTFMGSTWTFGDEMPGPAPCPDCGKADEVTYGQNAHGTWIGCIRCQNARDSYPHVPAAQAAWRSLTAEGDGA